MSYIGRDTDKISNVEVLDNITFDGSSSYTLQKGGSNFTPSSANTLLLSIDGVVQAGNFTVSGSTIDFGTAVAGTSTCDFILHYGVGLITAPSDGTVTTAKLGDSSVTTAKLNDASVSLAKLTATGTKNATTFLRGDNTFAAVTSPDYVLLSSTTPSAANTFSIDGHFTSDYDIYKIYAIGMSGASMPNSRVSMRVNVSGTAQTGNNHYYMTYIASGGSLNATWSNSTGQGHSDLGYVHSSSGSTAQAQFEFTIFRPLGTDKTTILHDVVSPDNGTTWGRYSGFTVWNVATAISGITLGAGAFGSGNIEADRILVYGLKI